MNKITDMQSLGLDTSNRKKIYAIDNGSYLFCLAKLGPEEFNFGKYAPTKNSINVDGFRNSSSGFYCWDSKEKLEIFIPMESIAAIYYAK